MKEFMLLFRMDITTPGAQPTPELMKTYMDSWNEWTSGIDRQGRMAGGNHLSTQGVVLYPGNEISESPYIAGRSSVAGYLVVEAKNLAEAIVLAGDCPVLAGNNTSVEIREIESRLSS